MTSNQQQPDDDSRPPETYTLGYSPSASERVTRRTAAQDASFFLPHLSAGMRLLDCGCGPGTITIGLAGIVSPGEVNGIDMEVSQIEQAKDRAAREAVANVQFDVGNLYEIPFPDAAFDAVMSHAVLNYLGDPGKALQEMWRVLKPGGVAGLRVSDDGGDISEPATDPVVERSAALRQMMVRHNGGNPFAGRTLRGLLFDAGFVKVQASASYDCFGTPELVKYWGERVAAGFTQPPISEQLTQLGLADEAELERIGDYWRAWGERSDAFYARCYCDAVGWKP